MSTVPPRPARRAAIVGTGHRARSYTSGIAAAAGVDVVALCDPNMTRMAVHNGLLTELGRAPASTWSPDDFAEMLHTERVDTLVVTTVDQFHDRYITAGLEAGLRVITEKPMTTDAEKCRHILDTVDRTGNHVTVTFNYRFNRAHAEVRRLLADGVIGDVLSVHFEWLLDVHHGADYFRRWHRHKANSGGLMVHKAGHHFDLVNWWLQSVPRTVFGFGGLGFYGRENGVRRGMRHDYDRATGADAAAGDPFALDLAGNRGLRALYLDAEHEDGYQRDRNVFADDITVEDDMAVLVRYSSGASLSYHLTAYSPWEGYRVMFNGSGGRLELEVAENTWRPPGAIAAPSGALHGADPAPDVGGARIVVRPLWQPPHETTVALDSGGHGGADERLLAALFGGAVDPAATDAIATERDGALALAVGAGANQSFVTGQPVQVHDLLGPI